jgi:hypothetical protein
MIHHYTAHDIAIFLLVSNFTQSDERAVIRAIWEDNKLSIPAEYRQDYSLFRRHINLELSKHDGALSDIDELNMLMRDAGRSFNVDGDINEQGIQGVIESYFKIIKLSLIYIEGKEYRKIKLRSLLKKFGYKRRSTQLVDYTQRTLMELGLKTYLKGYTPCDISEIGIDDMVMIRLEEK